MNPRILMLGLGLAIGYVLGTRDGRERYEEIKAKAQGIWEDPRVAKARREVESYARAQAPVIRERAEAAVKAAPGVAKDAAAKVAETAKDVAGTVADTAKDAAAKVTGTAKDAAARVTATAKDLRERGEGAVGGAVQAAGVARDRALDTDDDEDDPAAR